MSRWVIFEKLTELTKASKVSWFNPVFLKLSYSRFLMYFEVAKVFTPSLIPILKLKLTDFKFAKVEFPNICVTKELFKWQWWRLRWVNFGALRVLKKFSATSGTKKFLLKSKCSRFWMIGCLPNSARVSLQIFALMKLSCLSPCNFLVFKITWRRPLLSLPRSILRLEASAVYLLVKMEVIIFWQILVWMNSQFVTFCRRPLWTSLTSCEKSIVLFLKINVFTLKEVRDMQLGEGIAYVEEVNFSQRTDVILSFEIFKFDGFWAVVDQEWIVCVDIFVQLVYIAKVNNRITVLSFLCLGYCLGNVLD